MNSKVAWQMADSSRKSWSIWLSRRSLAWHTEPIIVFHGMIVHNRFYQKAMIKAVSSNHASIVLHDFSMYYTCVAVGESWVSESSCARMVRGPCHNASSRRDGLWVIESSPCCKWWMFGRNQWIYCLHIPCRAREWWSFLMWSTVCDLGMKRWNLVCSGAAAFRRARHDEEYRQDTWGCWKFMMELRSEMFN